MTELEKLCEQALYEEIQDLGDGKAIVRDVPTGRLFYRKELAVYNPQVFSYLKDHRNRSVPRIESFREDDGKLVVIEEYVQGRTLEHLLEEAEKVREADEAGTAEERGDAEEAKESEDPLPFRERIRILTEICDGLAFLHGAQPPIIHRDLKASNIMLTEDGVVKIIDYDAAKVYVRGEKRDTVLMGTHGIAAPEQYGFGPSDVRTDIYGLGKLIERMLPDNADADRIVARATHIDPKKRYDSAAQIRDQILRIREHPASLDTRLEKLVPGFDPQKTGHRVLARAVLALLCAGLAAAAGFFAWRTFVYPAQRRQAMEAGLETFQSGETPQEDVPGLIAQYLETYPYEKMSSGEQLEFRNAAEKALSRYSSGQEGRQQILSLLFGACGDEETVDRIDTYAQAERLLSSDEYGQALEVLRPLREAGLPDAGEKWEEALRRCRLKAAAQEESFEDKKTIRFAVQALDLYALMASVTDTGRFGDSALRDEALESFDQLFRKTLTQVDAESEAGNYDDAEKDYALLQELPAVGVAAQTDFEGKLLENGYREADARFAEGKYSSAMDLFGKLGDYGDAPTRTLECGYLAAGQHMEKEEYKKAAESYMLCAGYKDSDEKALEAKYLHCLSCAEKPDDDAYDYIEELAASGYPGAQAVRDVIYQWHVEIRNGLSLLVGSQQSSHIRVFLYGGPPGASTHLRLETTDNVDGSRTSWTSKDTCSRGGHVDASYNANTYEFSIFEREHTIKVYADDGQLIGSWTGVFTTDFMQDG